MGRGGSIGMCLHLPLKSTFGSVLSDENFWLAVIN